MSKTATKVNGKVKRTREEQEILVWASEIVSAPRTDSPSHRLTG
jgi:hypothetical protein